jgi:putative FmdB family regulatory protein
MPTYEYKCKKCGKVFEWDQRITEDALTTCPNEICEHEEKGSGEVFRLISKNVGLIFNGKGFYLTDYARKNSSAASNGNGHHHNGNGTTETKKEKTTSEAQKSDTKSASTTKTN